MEERECRTAWSDGLHAHVCGERGPHEEHVCRYCRAARSDTK